MTSVTNRPFFECCNSRSGESQEFSEGLGAVELGEHQLGYVNDKGELVIDPRTFREGREEKLKPGRPECARSTPA